MKQIEASGSFWSAWRADKETLKRQGIRVTKDESGRYIVTAPDDYTPPTFTRDTAPKIAAPVQAAIAVVAPIAQAIAQTIARVWSAEQEAIFGWYATGTGNLVIQARAGTGKTTTISHAFSKVTDPLARILYAVFNKKNQREALEKISDPRVEILTLHALGYKFIRHIWTNAKPDDSVEDDRILQVFRDTPDEVATQIKRLVAFAKNAFVGVPDTKAMLDLADYRDISAPGWEDAAAGSWTRDRLVDHAIKVMELSKVRDPQGRISFNDMVWLPVAMSWVRPWFDLVTIDECQDQNICQITMAVACCKPGGRVVMVGDDRQAIYGFRGAMQNCIPIMKEKLNAASLSLTTTYRCPKLVVEMARQIVPDYNAAPSAPEGVIETIGEYALAERVAPGDFVLSRANAPLMGHCLSVLKRGIPARIEGRDIGRQLVGIVQKLKARSVPDFLAKLDRWHGQQVTRILRSSKKYAETKVAAVDDQFEMLQALAQDLASVREIETRILGLFQDSDQNQRPAVVFSTVHKAKGLESLNVFMLEKTFNRKAKPGQKVSDEAKIEEANIRYVAITRSQSRLILVVDSANVKHDDGIKSVAA